MSEWTYIARLRAEHCYDQRRLKQELAEFLPAHDSLIDVGCGVKTFEAYIDGEYTGIDYNPALRPDVCADSRYLPFTDDTFDISVAKNHIQHVEQWKRVIEEMARVSRDYIVIEGPCHRSDTFYGMDGGNGETRIVHGIQDIEQTLPGEVTFAWSEIDPGNGIFLAELP